MNILIAGCGYVGSELARLLLSDGHSVWGMRRVPQGLPPDVMPIAADLSKPASLAGLPPGLDAVVYAAAAGGFDEARYVAAYVEGPANLLTALRSQGQHPRRFLFASSTGVYAQLSGEWVDEDSPAEPSHFSGVVLLRGEQTVLKGPFPSTVVRFAGIYGPGRTRMIESVRNGTATVSSTPTFVNHIHRDDCAGALRHLLMLQEPAPLYIGVDNEPVERGDMFRWLARRLGVPEPGGSGEPDSESVRAMRSNKRCSNARLRATGYEFRYPSFREGYEALLY
ncbi:MAG: SDR family oxidoreductase [Candidatus Hydrogenedentes bacterium]|nr:SDR family oxidoreductase [Candidatus Hydrogenedentota bacterium]